MLDSFAIILQFVFSEMVARLSRIAAVGEAEAGDEGEEGESHR